LIVGSYYISDDFLIWTGFITFVILLLALDLGVFNRKSHKVTVKEALMWTAFWITLAMVFNTFIYFWQGHQAGLEFLTGYLLEKSLSVDNLFVFLIILTYFSVSRVYWHRVLFYGILGALIMRGLFIGVGITIITAFHPVLYIFGVILIITAIKVAVKKDEDIHPEKNPVLRFFRKIIPVTKNYEGGKFFTRHSGKLFATPLFIVLIAIETTDVVFAMDSVPAIFGITLNPFIVYTSNVFAILGLRALFFAIAGAMEKIYYLNYGLSVILGFIGVKILLAMDFLPFHYEIPVGYALLIVILTLAMATAASYMKLKHDKTGNDAVPEPGTEKMKTPPEKKKSAGVKPKTRPENR
jgi:tellurite resistance protein TerC